MRILVASHTYIVPLNCEKFRVLATLAADVQVTVVVPQYWQLGSVHSQAIASQPWQSDRFRVVPVSNFSRNHQSLLLFGPDLVRLLHQFRPHILQVEQGSKALTYVQLITLNRVLGLKALNVFFTWWNIPYHLPFPVSLLEAYNLRQTAGAIAGNEAGATILRQRGYRGPLRVLPQLGVDEQRFCAQPQPDLRQRLGIPAKTFVVGFVGRFVEEKGLLTLAEALAGLVCLPWCWLLVGRGPLREQVTQRAQSMGMGDRLIWVDSVPHTEVPRYLNLMDVLILPSQRSDRFKTLTAGGWEEQFGHVLIEAMACRVPVIGSNSGAIPQVIGDAGGVFPAGDAAALRQHLKTLMEQPHECQQWAQRGYERAIAHYTNRVLAQQQLAFYRELLEMQAAQADWDLNT